MIVRIVFIVALFLPFRVAAWDDDAVLSFIGRVSVGGTEFRDDPYTVFGGLQINIPLSSVKEEREAALKQVAEAKPVIAVDDLTNLTPTQVAFWLAIFDHAQVIG
ncbi:hypothetical protein [Methylotuvimicrobium buryatense]|nr:hypothetical protein [Methylotuvimicrobium buryatense]